MAGGPERVQAALDAQGLDTKVMRLPESTRTAPEAAKAAGCEVGAIAKSLLFLADGEPLLVICSGDRRVNTERVAGMVGASGLKMAPAEEVRRVTGYAIGGVPPLGHALPIPKLMDTALFRYATIYAAAGAHDAIFPIAPQRLAEVTGARVEDVGAP
jgi:prolyl-tRNA editing enzyme YbaK/EbsC (Cys-tRNA(Pro) deacylase)